MQNWNRFPRALLVLSLLIVLCAGLFAPRADVVEAKPLRACPDPLIAEWTFAGDVVTTSTGIGTFSSGAGLVPPGSPYTFAAGEIVSENNAISFTGLNTVTLDPAAFIAFQVDTTDRSALGVNFKSRISATGPTVIDLYYSTNNWVTSTFISSINSTTFPPLINDANWHTYNFDLSAFTTIENNPNVQLGLFAYGASAGGGTWRTDNVTITGDCLYSPLSLVINEVAWAGTAANDAHEWIEIYNPSSTPIDLNSGWHLSSSDGSPNIDFSTATCATPACTVPAGGYFLLERDTDGAISDISADYVYTGALANGGESLTLYDPSGGVIDTANGDGGVWPAGNDTSFASMERTLTLPVDSDIAWYTNNGITRTGVDYNQDPILGTPKLSNAPTSTPTTTITSTSTTTSTPTATTTLTPTITSTPSGVRSIIINEVAWAGTASGLSSDEWIELYNPSSVAVNISGWSLRATDGEPNITLNNVSIPAGSYYLLERDDNNTVSDIAADQIYFGSLENGGEILTLYDGSNRVIDTANRNGGVWPRGSASTYGTMERIGNSTESDSSWRTNTGTQRNGKNANNGNIWGTPKARNSASPTFTPSAVPTSTRTPTPAFIPPDPRPIINEILPRPGFDWNKDGKVDVFDEFVEIKNLTSIDISLKDWKLDDELNLGSNPFTLPDITLKPGQRVVFFALETNILLSDGGDTVRLISPNGKIYDAYTYSIAKVEDQSICRLPDGNAYNGWFEDCIPTPNLTNTREGAAPTTPDVDYESPVCKLPDTLPADFLFAECHGYGADIWDADFWDQPEISAAHYFPQNTSKWEAIIE